MLCVTAFHVQGFQLMSRALWWSEGGGGQFLMSEGPLQPPAVNLLGVKWGFDDPTVLLPCGPSDLVGGE